MNKTRFVFFLFRNLCFNNYGRHHFRGCDRSKTARESSTHRTSVRRLPMTGPSNDCRRPTERHVHVSRTQPSLLMEKPARLRAAGTEPMRSRRPGKLRICRRYVRLPVGSYIPNSDTPRTSHVRRSTATCNRTGLRLNFKHAILDDPMNVEVAEVVAMNFACNDATYYMYVAEYYTDICAR